MLAEPELFMRMFRDAELAASFQSSLIGTTTYQQQGVTHQSLRAAAIGRPEHLLRAPWRPRNVDDSPQLSGAALKAAKREADHAMKLRMLELQVGDRIYLSWECGTRSDYATIAERPVVGMERSMRAVDVGVRLRYDQEPSRIVSEHLGWGLEWKLVRGREGTA